jgi:uncharacterized protein (TIGR02147 family)
MISIFEYQQYRDYLRDFYLDQKLRKTGMTYVRFSEAAGIRSPNYLKVVIDAQKSLTPENIIRFAKALGLKEHESDYFEALVHFNQAKNLMQREYFEERLQRVRKRYAQHGTKDHLLDEYAFEAVSDWKYHALMVLTNVRGFEDRLGWIRERFFNLVSEQEIASMIQRLQAVGLISRDANGRLKQTFRQVNTRPEITKAAIRPFFEGILARAAQAWKLTEPEEREFKNYLVGLSPSQLPELKRKVNKFMKELNEWAMENQKPHQVYSFTFAAFPVTTIEKRHGQ